MLAGQWQAGTRGNLIRLANFDLNAKPVSVSHGYHQVEYEFDEFGNLLEERYFDVNADPTRVFDGYARRNYEYDEQGNQIATWYFDEQELPFFEG